MSNPLMLTSNRFPGLGLLILLLLAGCSDQQPPLPSLAADAVILAFGDSLTRGAGAGKEESYPAVLQGLVGRQVINAGVPGEVSEDGARRLPGLLDSHQPQLLLLCHGGNDLLRKVPPKRTESHLRAMLETSRARGVAVVLIGVPKPGLLLGTAEVYERLAQEYELPYVDRVLGDILGERDLKSDTIHPNAAGYRELARGVYQVLKESGAL